MLLSQKSKYKNSPEIHFRKQIFYKHFGLDQKCFKCVVFFLNVEKGHF